MKISAGFIQVTHFLSVAPYQMTLYEYLAQAEAVGGVRMPP